MRIDAQSISVGLSFCAISRSHRDIEARQAKSIYAAAVLSLIFTDYTVFLPLSRWASSWQHWIGESTAQETIWLCGSVRHSTWSSLSVNETNTVSLRSDVGPRKAWTVMLCALNRKITWYDEFYWLFKQRRPKSPRSIFCANMKLWKQHAKLKNCQKSLIFSNWNVLQVWKTKLSGPKSTQPPINLTQHDVIRFTTFTIFIHRGLFNQENSIIFMQFAYVASCAKFDQNLLFCSTTKQNLYQQLIRSRLQVPVKIWLK